MKLNAMQHVCCRQLLAKWPPCTPERYSLAATVMSEVLAKTVCAEDVSTFELQTRWEEGAYDARTSKANSRAQIAVESKVCCHQGLFVRLSILRFSGPGMATMILSSGPVSPADDDLSTLPSMCSAAALLREDEAMGSGRK